MTAGTVSRMLSFWAAGNYVIFLFKGMPKNSSVFIYLNGDFNLCILRNTNPWGQNRVDGKVEP